MNTKSLKVLRITALVIGWLLIVDFIRISLDTVNLPTDQLKYVSSSINNREIAYWAFSKFGGIFLAFLISAVVRMIEMQVPVGKALASRLMIVCCLSYTAATFVRIYQVINEYMGYGNYAFFNFYYRTLLMHISRLPVFVPLLYAVSIFILYNHFIKMVTFESEVA